MPDAPSTRERKSLIALLQTASVVDAFGHLQKKQFMDRPGDQARIAERVFEMRKRAGELSDSFRKAYPDAPWAELESVGRSPEELWRAAKKIAPAMIAELQPLVADEPEAAFSLAEERKRRGKKGSKA